jgi:hypothetical protein
MHHRLSAIPRLLGIASSRNHPDVNRCEGSQDPRAFPIYRILPSRNFNVFVGRVLASMDLPSDERLENAFCAEFGIVARSGDRFSVGWASEAQPT